MVSALESKSLGPNSCPFITKAVASNRQPRHLASIILFRFCCLYVSICRFSLVLATVRLSYVLGKNKKKASSWIAPRPHIIMIVADDLVRSWELNLF